VSINVVLSSNSKAGYTQACTVRYTAETGQLKTKKLDVTFISGSKLNEAINSFEYSSSSVYATIFLQEGQASIIRMPTLLGCGAKIEKNCVASAIGYLKGQDQDNNNWEINVGGQEVAVDTLELNPEVNEKLEDRATPISTQIPNKELQTRVALVIGIKNYTSVSPLQNSLNDAQDMSKVLKERAFNVIEILDPKTKRELIEAIKKFYAILQNSKNGIGLFYYSGHGIQVDGSNYFIPANASPDIKADIEEQCLNMDYVMRAVEQANSTLNIFILDACRNNPFKSFSRSTDTGLSMVSAPKGSYIVYATKPGSVASDGNGRNGLFTSKLLKFINSPDLSIEEVFKNVAAEVARESNDAQRPWISSDFTGNFYFSKEN
jgi:Caspase domain